MSPDHRRANQLADFITDILTGTYCLKINNLKEMCKDNNMLLHINKTKELITD